jgi:radical SAM-linked protein
MRGHAQDDPGRRFSVFALQEQHMTDSTELPPRQRVRILYEKGEGIKFITHLDEFRMWERALRRADLPLLYKQGFNPQPHIQFASPLGVGFTGLREPIDITFSPPLPLEEISERIVAKLPPAASLHAIEEVPLKTESLQSVLIGADYTILIYTDPGELADEVLIERIDSLLAMESIPRKRQRKGRNYTYNLRPLVHELEYKGYDDEKEEHCIFLRVQQRAGPTGRPDDVIDALGLDDYARTLRRDKLYVSNAPDDVAVFAGYPVITQEEILIDADPAPPKKRGRRPKRRKKDQTEQTGRSMNERAADEFV